VVKLFRTYGAVVFAMIFWAFSFIWFKTANIAYSPLIIIYLRLLISALLLTIFLTATKRFNKIRKCDRIYFLLLAVSEPFLYFLGESFGLTYVSSTVGAVVISTIPLFTAIGGWLFFKEKLQWLNYLGIIISLAGVLIFVFNADGTLSFDPRGLALLGLACLSAVSYTLFLKKLAGNYNPIYIVNVQNVIGLILFTPVILIFDRQGILDFTYFAEPFWATIKLAVFGSSLAFILFGYAVRNLGATKANVFSNAIPVFTAIFAYLLLGESLSLQKIIGMAIVISGLLLSQTRKREWTKPDGTILAGKTA
jgi:drug/metabolite transporter (DMT)-like permease